MKAFRYENPVEGLRLEDVPIPEPKQDQVQILVMAAGICHSDSHIVEGHGERFIGRTPITLGHEVAGIVTKIGSSVHDFNVGERVAVVLPCHPVGTIDTAWSIGLSYDGGFAEYAISPASRVIKIPGDLSFQHAAVATDALATAFHAVVQEAGAAPGVTIGIIGLGGLGMPGLGIAVLKGADVYGFDVTEAKFPEAIELGAKGCFKSPADAEHVSFDAVVDFYGSSETTAAAITAVRMGGRVVGVGLQSPVVNIPTSNLRNGYILKQVTLVGSLGSSVEDVKSVMEMVRSGVLKTRLTEIPFSDIPATISLLSKNAGIGRYWADPSKA
ncbi:adh2-alcohol dehydrogenase ii [Fusarium sporotrichioides]|uniref:Adh2-alcohol dehydrogenase ii n=1 Tax=Fusarium sporotrichioides TaxID=5514 RepID=A0A395RL82_FUSSP|nr:adh2-alcohol dehydrogenase ii [Fusarium sporotrichioides]